MKDDGADGSESDQNYRQEVVEACYRFLPAMELGIRGNTALQTCYAIKTRVKSFGDIDEKIRRKRGEGRDDYSFNQIGDLAGIRLVTLYKSEIPNFLQEVLRYLVDSSRIPNGILCNCEIKEILCLYNNDLDPLVNDIETLHLNSDLVWPLGPTFEKRRNYSSVHVLIKVPKKGTHADKTLWIPCEIQIRSVIEDAWAELDHKVKYVRTRTGRHQGDSEFEHMSNYLDLMKRSVDASSDIADLIRSLMDPRPGRPSNVARNLGEVDYVSKVLELCHVSIDIAERINSLLAKKRSIDEALESSDPDVQIKKSYHEIGVSLIKLQEELYSAELKFDDKFSGLVKYTILMEAALCFFLADDAQDLVAAAKLYEEISSDPQNKERPAALFRLAQVYQKQAALESSEGPEAKAYVERAAAAYTKALVLAKKAVGSPRLRSLHLGSPDQVTHVIENAGRHIGFLYWNLMKRTRQQGLAPEAEHLDWCVKAFEQALKTWQESGEFSAPSRIKSANNLVYFALDVDRLLTSLKSIQNNRIDSGEESVPNHQAAHDSRGEGHLAGAIQRAEHCDLKGKDVREAFDIMQKALEGTGEPSEIAVAKSAESGKQLMSIVSQLDTLVAAGEWLGVDVDVQKVSKKTFRFCRYVRENFPHLVSGREYGAQSFREAEDTAWGNVEAEFR